MSLVPNGLKPAISGMSSHVDSHSPHPHHRLHTAPASSSAPVAPAAEALKDPSSAPFWSPSPAAAGSAHRPSSAGTWRVVALPPQGFQARWARANHSPSRVRLGETNVETEDP